jgi:hypothetical protein
MHINEVLKGKEKDMLEDVVEFTKKVFTLFKEG